jgi:hypothetical protein
MSVDGINHKMQKKKEKEKSLVASTVFGICYLGYMSQESMDISRLDEITLSEASIQVVSIQLAFRSSLVVCVSPSSFFSPFFSRDVSVSSFFSLS